jgi:hypothetical protein
MPVNKIIKNNNVYTENDYNNLRKCNFKINIDINNWLNSPENNSSEKIYKWVGEGLEPPYNWYNKDIVKIIEHINRENNRTIGSYDNSLTPGTTNHQKVIWYKSYEDWFFDNYKPILNKESVSIFYNKLLEIIENKDYKINNQNRFKKDLINFIYKNST